MKKNGISTREKILKVTKALVLQNGYVGTTIDQILDEAKITKGAFFYHFKSKSDLAFELMNEYVKDDLAELSKALELTQHLKEDPLKRLIQFVDIFIETMEGIEEPPPGCLYASYGYETVHFSEDIKKLISSSILSWRQAIEKMLDEAMVMESPKTEMDKAAIADMFVVIFEGSFILSKALNDPGLIAKQLHNFKNYLKLLFIPDDQFLQSVQR